MTAERIREEWVLPEAWSLVPATTPEHAEAMRQIRNACRAFMTIDQDEIAYEQQQGWFRRLDRSVTRPYLYPTSEKGVYGGYGLLRLLDARELGRSAPEGKTWWVSGGLVPELRGKGHGRALFSALTMAVNSIGKICYLEVLADNLAAIATYRSLGYEDISGLGDTVRKVMRRIPMATGDHL